MIGIEELLTKVRNRLRRGVRATVRALHPPARLQRTVPKTMKIAIAVLSYERPEYLDYCLETLFQTRLYDYDVTFFIVDDGSSDPRVREIIERPRGELYKIVRAFTPKGHNSWGAAFNKAMRLMLEYGTFDILGTCDSDALFHPEWLDRTLKVALWAKENHRSHILGPFSSFNSSNGDFHGVLGTYDSPHGRFVVKRRMGAVNYLYFREDFAKLGFFPESRDDETLMTDRFEMLKVRNFCTENTYVEHVGELSLLNSWRPVSVYRPAFGLGLPQNGWPTALERARTVGYYRDVQKVQSVGNVESLVQLDVLILAAAGEAAFLRQTVEGLRRHLRHPIGTISVVGPSIPELELGSVAVGCEFVPEEAILPFGESDDVRRCPGWLRREILRFSGNTLFKRSHYLVVKAGNVLLRPQVFETGGMPVLLLNTDTFHDPHKDVFAAVSGLPSFPAFDSLRGMMMISVERLQAFKAYIAARHGKEWWRVLVDYVTEAGLERYPECELYCQWSLAHYADATVWEYSFHVSGDLQTADLESEPDAFRFVSLAEAQKVRSKLVPYLQAPNIRPRLSTARLDSPDQVKTPGPLSESTPLGAQFG